MLRFKGKSIAPIKVIATEDLDTELNTQDSLLADLETNINNLPEAGGSSGEWQPHPDWWDIEKIYNEDTTEKYTHKAILLLYGGVEKEYLSSYSNFYSYGLAVKTSDGAFYESVGENTVHNWDLSKDKPCYVNGVEVYTTRYVILYYANNVLSFNDIANHAIMTKGLTKAPQFKWALKVADDIWYNNATSFVNICSNGYALEAVRNIDTSNITNFSSAFSNCIVLPYLFQIDTSKGTSFNSMFEYCRNLKYVFPMNVSNGTNFSNMFRYCTNIPKIELYDTSKGTSFNSMLSECRNLKYVSPMNVSNGTNFDYMFNSCTNIPKIELYDTSKGTDFDYMFKECFNVESISTIDLINAKYVTSMFMSCTYLTNLILKNIKISLQIGSGTSWGHKLTLESLLNTIKELHDNTSGSSTLTLTVGSANLAKLANVYVKLIDITDEMRAEDEYIDNKLPFEVCESTDEGAMSVTEYVTSKNWQIK